MDEVLVEEEEEEEDTPLQVPKDDEITVIYIPIHDDNNDRCILEYIDGLIRERFTGRMVYIRRLNEGIPSVSFVFGTKKKWKYNKTRRTCRNNP